MNILASYDWLKEYLKKSADAEEFVRRMTEVGNSVEHVLDVGATLANIVVGKILEVKAHPNADKLRVVVVAISPPLRGSTPPAGGGDRGGGSRGGERSVEIVCGGSNLEVGHLVVVALPGAMVKWHGEGELVEIKETELRGVKSYGMICAAAEIGFEKLKQADREIWDLTELVNAKPGTPIAEALELNDLLFDIEVTTNRPDAMGIVGLAREAGAAGLGKFEMPKVDISKKAEGKKSITQLPNYSIAIEATNICPRYQAVVIDNVQIKPSPWWMQKRLLLSGHRPINNVVDVTNYILHELGQPLHAFDADKLAGEKIVVREAKKGEKILALDGKEYELDSSMLVIADADKPVAVAGVMGGELTGTTESTTRLVIESANFHPVSVRRTARALNLYSDSSSLFEKGLSTESTTLALHRAIELICELTGGHVASAIADERAKAYEAPVFPYDPDKVSALMGVEVKEKEQKEILEALGFVINKDKITVPYWRDHDIEDSVDFSEEVARMYGYGNLPSVLPPGEIPAPAVEPMVIWERKLKEILKAAGATETYSMAFVDAPTLEKLDLPLASAVHLQNPLSEEMAYMRPTIFPSMMLTVEQNQHRFPEASLFEISAVHKPIKGDIPERKMELMLCVYHTDGAVAFTRAKGLLERMLREAGVTDVRIEAKSDLPYLHPGRSALVTIAGIPMGTIGEVSSTYTQRFGIDKRVVGCGLHLDLLLPHLGVHPKYASVPTFPDTTRDISFVLSERSTYADVSASLRNADALITEVVLLDVYQGKGIEEGKKSMAFRLNLRATDRTLSSDEADAVMQRVSEMLKTEFSALIR